REVPHVPLGRIPGFQRPTLRTGRFSSLPRLALRDQSARRRLLRDRARISPLAGRAARGAPLLPGWVGGVRGGEPAGVSENLGARWYCCVRDRFLASWLIEPDQTRGLFGYDQVRIDWCKECR